MYDSVGYKTMWPGKKLMCHADYTSTYEKNKL